MSSMKRNREELIKEKGPHGSWLLNFFPIAKKEQFIKTARENGMTALEAVEHVVDEYLEKNESGSDKK